MESSRGSRRFFAFQQEFAVASPTAERDGLAVGGGRPSALLVSAALRHLRHLPACQRGIFLPNGSFLHARAEGRPQCSTPECSNPAELVRYMLAGERLVYWLARRVSPSLLVFKGCFDYSGSGASWAGDEHHWCLRDLPELAAQLLPHLISRAIYTGAGGFDAYHAGVRFVLSPRAPHLLRRVRAGRPLEDVLLRASPRCTDSPVGRVKLACGETSSSHLSTWLRFGTTALLIALIEAGERPASGLELVSPADALERVAGDLTCTAGLRMRQGPPRTALQIQRRLLELVEDRLESPCLPEWAPEVCDGWRRVLDLLETDPLRLDTALEWRTKWALYDRWLRSRGLSWELLDRWNPLLERLRIELDAEGLRSPSVRAEDPRRWEEARQEVVRKLTPRFKRRGLDWDALSLLRAVREELFELETRFGQLGPDGIFERLERRGLLHHRMVGESEIVDAGRNPPRIGRARVLGEQVRARWSDRHRYRACWNGILDTHNRRWLDLPDPAVEELRWIVPSPQELARYVGLPA